jgi:hypothetical protein
VNRRSFVVALGVAVLIATGEAGANGAIEVTNAQLDTIADRAAVAGSDRSDGVAAGATDGTGSPTSAGGPTGAGGPTNAGSSGSGGSGTGGSGMASGTNPPGTGHTLLLSADIVLPLTDTLKDSVNRGLALYFQTDVQLVRPRWYWWNEQVVSTSIEWRLSYHALTRQYRVATNARGQAFATLDEALAVMSAIRSVPIGRVERLDPGQRYDVWVRMRLDTGRLPKPFQMTAMTNRDWNPQSEWKRFDFIGPRRNDAR